VACPFRGYTGPPVGLPRPILAAALSVLAALVAVGAGAAAVQANSVTFPDSTGEDAQGPDIVSVRVANDDRGNVTFTINMPNRPMLTGDMVVLISLDTDANPATGEPESLGSDYAIELDGPLTGAAGVGLFRWNGTEFTADGVAQRSLIFSYAPGAATIRINAAELGATKRFGFGVIAVTGVVLSPSGEPDFTNIHVDFAPDQGHGLHSYDVKTAPPSLVVRSFRSSPARARAGTRYTVSATVVRSDTGATIPSGRVTCRAAIAGRSLRGRPSLAGGRASCSFTIPASARGKTIRGSMTVVSQGLRKVQSFSARIA
jgi:hypothetical protein